MAEPKLRLVDADENYVVPIDATDLKPLEKIAVREKKFVADGIKEGRRREKADTLKKFGAQHIADISAIPKLIMVHQDQLALVKSTVGAKSLYKGMAIGLAFSVFTGIMGLIGGYALFERGVAAQLVATQRDRAGNVPAIPYEGEAFAYDHDRREPADAQR